MKRVKLLIQLICFMKLIRNKIRKKYLKALKITLNLNAIPFSHKVKIIVNFVDFNNIVLIDNINDVFYCNDDGDEELVDG